MFTTGQLIFALFFFVAFTAIIFISYKRDKKLHIKYYKGSGKVLIGFILFIVILLFLKSWVKQ